jgi:hypothetical protein
VVRNRIRTHRPLPFAPPERLAVPA